MEYIGDVLYDYVSGTIPREDIEVCRRIAEKDLGVKFRVR